jgi:hypothetical protein
VADITYPRDMLAPLSVEKTRFVGEPLGAFSRTQGGRVAFQHSVGGSLWQATFVSNDMSIADYEKWYAFYLSVIGETFKAFDPAHRYPLAYSEGGVLALPPTRAAGGAFDGTATVTAAGGRLLSLSGLPNGYQVKTGDYVSFAWLGGQNIVKALADVAATSGGIITDLPIRPWLRAGGTVPVTAQIGNPYCLMTALPGTFQGDRNGLYAPCSFDAIQYLD